MKYGAYGLIWSPEFKEEQLYLFEKLKNMGFEGIEVPLGYPFLGSLPVSGIKRKREETGLRCVCSTGLDEERNIISPDPGRRQKGIDFLRRCIEMSADLGSDVLSGVLYAPWGGFTGEARTSNEWGYCKEGLSKVAEVAKECSVFLAIEPVNRFESYFLNTAEDGRKLIEEIGHPNIKLHLDTFQMNIEEDSLYKAIKTAGDLLYHFHCCASHRGIPGTGHIDWVGVFRGLTEVGYERWLIIESFNVEAAREFGKQAAVWRELAAPDRIAKEGLDYLKRVEKHVFASA